MSRPTIAPVADERNRPLWSVMIPVYRPDIAWLREAVSGPLGSGFDSRDMQIALVDDGGGQADGGDADAFWRECEQRGIEIHRFDRQAGLPGNWNRCLQLSRGRLIHILHQDDRVRPEFYSAMAAGLRAAPDAGAAFSQHVFIDGEGAAIRSGHLDRPSAGLLDDWLEYVVANLAIQCPAIVVRRATYEKLGGFDDAYDYCPDYDMWQRIALQYPLWFDPLPLADFRVHDRSASSTRVRRLASWHEVLRCRDIAMAGISPPARESVQLSARRHTLRWAIRECRTALANRDWRRSIAALSAIVTIGQMRDIAPIVRGRFNRAPIGRPPPRPAEFGANRLPRILLITEFFPIDPTKCVFGAFRRLRRHLDALSRLGPVDAVFLWGHHTMSSAETRKHTEMVKQFWPIEGSVRFIKVATGRRRTRDWIVDAMWALRGSVGFYHTAATMRTCRSEQAAATRQYLGELQPDLIFAYRLGGAAPLLRADVALPPVVIDIDDVEHIKLERLAATMPPSRRKLKLLAEAWLARHALRRMSKMASCLLVASELDQAKIPTSARDATVAVNPNTASTFIEPAESAAMHEPILLFVGVGTYPPNKEAVVWLAREIWPLVRRQVPQARLLLVGEGMQQALADCPTDGIDVLGFVADLAPIYQRIGVALCPIRRGAGTRIKIIEAAMNSRPVVSTVLGAEGLCFVPDREILLEDTPQGFAEACVKLLSDAALAATIAKAARQRAEANYAPDVVAERLAALCASLIDPSTAIAGTLAHKSPPASAAPEDGQRTGARWARG